MAALAEGGEGEGERQQAPPPPESVLNFQPVLDHLTFRSYSELYEPSDDTFLFMDGEGGREGGR